MTFNEPHPALVDEWAASIAHEANQPLATIVTHAESCLAWLGKKQPDLDRPRKAAERIVRTGHHASDVERSIGAMLRESPPHLAPLDINALIASLLDLTGLRVSTSLECDSTVCIAVTDFGTALDAATLGRSLARL